MWSDFSGKAYSRGDFTTRIASLTWSDWKPIGITLHNTAAPTLAQWAESGPAHDARILNLQSYYEGMGWHGGPHWFISRDWLNEFSNPLRRGTHSPSFNATHLGIEMVGDYARETFNTGDGAKVRDNAVFAMAILCRKFGWDPAKAIVLHKEDPRTTHDCPGKFVVKSEVIARVKAEMERLAGQPVPVIPDKVDGPSDPPPKWKAPDSPAFKDDVLTGRMTNITATVFGGAGDEQSSAYGGMVDPDKPGVALPFRFRTARPKVRLSHAAATVDADIVDVGPWNIDDAYWDSNGRPAAEAQFKNKTPAFKSRVPTNDAGIDLTPAAARAIGLIGKGKIDWEFVGAVDRPAPRTPMNKTKIPIKDKAVTGGIVVAGTIAAQQAAANGVRPAFIIAIVAATIAIGAMMFLFFHNRNKK